ncbi:MAG: helix-turn-helix domain-containing protein [Sphingomonadaceae bacterium]
MAAKRINPRLIKLHRTYSVEEASERLGVHKNTVRNWQCKGLEPIDQSRPVLFLGRALREFLETQRKKAKQPCPPGTLYCFKCRAPRPPALGMVDYTPRNATYGNLKAICGECDAIMNRSAARASLATKMPKIAVQIVLDR